MGVPRRTTFLVVALSVALIIGDAEAGWKFWKKNKDASSTTIEPTSSTSTTTTTTTPRPLPSSTGRTQAAIAGAADPGLAVGIGSNGRADARPRRPNPGTEVGLDVPSRSTGTGSGSGSGSGTGGTGDARGSYRDWAAHLTGAGEPQRQPPRLPSQGPALSPTGHQPGQGPRPTPLPAGASSGQPQTGAPASGPRATPQTPTPAPTPAPRPPQPARSADQAGAQGLQNAGGNQVSTLYVTLRPGVNPTPVPSPSRPASPGSPTSPTGGRTWADVARPGSPSAPTSPPAQASSPSPRPGIGSGVAGVAGAAGVAAVAGGNRVYSSNPTYSKGNTVTDEDLEKLSEALYIKETNNANRYVTLNLQKRTSSNSKTDEAPQPLFTVDPRALQIPTVEKVVSIFDNYQLDTRASEYISPAQRQEESLLVDTFLSTNVMSAAMKFLADKGYVRKDYYEYKDTLRRLWFNLFSRGEGKIGSTGFEHVFMTELKPGTAGTAGTSGTEVIGLHNWIYYSIEETKRRADYLGYIDKIDLGNKGSIVKIHTKFDGHDKPVTTMFVGTSPELEMALYTVCFFAREGRACGVSLGGTRFNIITHKFRYRGKDLIGTAYPDI